VRESTLQLINIAMIMTLVLTLPVHIAMQAFLGVGSYDQSLTYGTVTARYASVITVTLLTVLLAAALFHGLYGVRKILLEFKSGPSWDRLVSLGTLALGLVILGWGLRTIVVMGWGL